MKDLAKFNRRDLLLIGTLVVLLAAAFTSAQAAEKSKVLRNMDGDHHTGRCCSSWDETVAIREPEVAAAIVVTWSTDYQTTTPFLVGLKINGGGCTFFGPAFIPAAAPSDDTSASISFQWVILPGDYGLVKGNNTFTLCGGGVFSEGDSITLGFNTLTVRLQK